MTFATKSANSGRFEEKDGRGILSFADTAKSDEVATIDRFGFGQKAVFHLCRVMGPSAGMAPLAFGIMAKEVVDSGRRALS
jgi:hypothetical protein